jgi:two-component system, OmpR family, response regulator ResD
MMQRELVLVVDDNEDIRNFVRASLEGEGFRVIEAVDGESALEKFIDSKPSVIILDLSIGQPDGFEVCREIRKTSSVPIIMLTNRGEEMDEAMCLAAGADDYITKPVSSRILNLRVTTQLRHRSLRPSVTPLLLEAENLSLNTESRELMVGTERVALTKTEYDFFHLLMEQPTRVFTRDQVIEAIGGSVDYASDHLLDTHASRLRLKIKAAGGPRVISAIRGVGYRLIPLQ